MPGRRLLLTGEPGAGRTALLERVANSARARGVQVLHTRCPRGDAGRRFTGLAALLADVDRDHVDHLVPVQRAALEVAVAPGPSGPPAPSLILHVAVASLLDRLVAQGPVLLVVDDWPWLDPGTDAALRYVLDRPAQQLRQVSLLAGQQLQQVLTGRPDLVDGRVFRPTAVLPVPPLEPAVLGRVVTTRTGRVLAPPELAALHAATGGNPGWALEVLGAGAPLGPVPPLHEDPLGLVPASIAGALATRLGEVPAPASDVLLAAAAGGGTTPVTLAAVVPDSDRAVVSALEHGVVEFDGARLRPSHPVLAHAALGALDPEARRRLHRRLAGAVADPVARVRHLDAAAAPGPDETLATALAAAGSGTGPHDAALALLERAVERSVPGSPGRWGRVVALTRTALDAERPEHALRALADLDREHCDLADVDRGVALLTRDPAALGGEHRVGELLDLLDRCLRDDPTRAAVLRDHRSWSAGTGGTGGSAVSPGPPRAPLAQHRALATLLRRGVEEGRGVDPSVLRRSEFLEGRGLLVPRQDSARAQQAALDHLVEDVPAALTALTRLREEAARVGDQDAATAFTHHLAAVHVLAGSPSRAAGLLRRAGSAPRPGGAPPVALLRARGLLALARDDAAEVARLTMAPRGGPVDDVARVLRTGLPGVLAARTERWAQAVGPLTAARSLADAAGVREPGCRWWLDVELAETFVALGRRREAAEVAERFAELAAGGGRPVARAQELRLRGLLAAAHRDLEQAEDLLTASAALLPETTQPLEHGRSLLHLAHVLRRRRARSRSHELLVRVRDLARRIEDEPLRARVELALRAFPSTGGVSLTPAELAIAHAVAGGASNREIAAAQFLSVRTVESHLSRVFRKTGVRSRTELAVRWQEQVPAAG